MVSPLNHRLHKFSRFTGSRFAEKKSITQIFFLVFGVWCLVFGESVPTSKNIRVLIIQDAESLSLKVNGFYAITDLVNKKVLYRGKNLKTTVVTYKDGILLGQMKFKIPNLVVKPNDTEAIMVNNRKIRGDIEFIKKDNAHLYVINYIDLEDYIKGISVRETSHYWPTETLKAQVIVFRTFALYKMQENAKNDYDLTSDIYSQVYGGRAAERYRINRAIDETKGLALTYRGKIFPAFYHATCASHTEDASLLWNIDIAPLKGIPCNFCKGSPHFKWHQVLSQEQIKAALQKAGYTGFKNIKDIVIEGTDSSGRITDLKIITDAKEIKISAKDFRNIIGPNVIRSTNFKLNLVEQDIVFEGFGWGHGVGLCQWGAYFMGKQGYNYVEILKYYYPGSDVKTLGF